MGTLTIRLPDDRHNRLKALAKHRKISINKLMEELSTIAVAEFDAEIRFRALSAKDCREQGLALLDKLDSKSFPEVLVSIPDVGTDASFQRVNNDSIRKSQRHKGKT